MTAPSKAHAAQALGMPVDEIVDVDEHPHGYTVTEKSGARYLWADTPDGAGVTGLMFLEAPDPDRVYALHIFEPPEPDDDTEPTPEPDVEPPAAAETPERPPEGGPGSGVKAWRAYAVAMGVPADEAADLDRDEIIARFPDEDDTDA